MQPKNREMRCDPSLSLLFDLLMNDYDEIIMNMINVNLEERYDMIFTI